MLASSEDARDAAELERRAEERGAHRLAILIEVLAARPIRSRSAPRRSSLPDSLNVAAITLPMRIAPVGATDRSATTVNSSPAWRSRLMSTRYS